MSVFEYVINKPLRYEITKKTWSVPISESKKSDLISLYAEFKKGRLFNSEAVRLDGIIAGEAEDTIVLSKTSFFDLVLSNIVSNEIEPFKLYIQDNHNGDGIESLEKLNQFFIRNKYDSLEDLINNGNYSNALAVSILLIDPDENVLLTKRSSGVGIGQDLLSVTATGAMDSVDCRAADPFIECAKRELQEELRLRDHIDSIYAEAIVAGKKKRQPIVLITGKVRVPFLYIEDEMKKAADFSFETAQLIVVEQEKLDQVLQTGNLTEAGRNHLSRHIIKG